MRTKSFTQKNNKIFKKKISKLAKKKIYKTQRLIFNEDKEYIDLMKETFFFKNPVRKNLSLFEKGESAIKFKKGKRKKSKKKR